VTRQPDFSTAPRPERLPAWETLAVAAGVIAVALAAWGAWRARDEERSARARLAEVRREVEAAARRHRALDALARGPALGLTAAEAPPARVVAELASVLPAGVRLQRLVIDYARAGEVEMEVVARDAFAWDQLLARLDGAPWLREVEPGPEARDAEVRTVVRAKWAGGGR
jgi:hypothetical protein